MKIESTFELLGWDEHLYFEAADSPAKLSRAMVTKRFTGELNGEASLEYLMVYDPEGNATFVGIERVDGELAGRRGSFVLRHVGVFESGIARAEVEVVPASGTDELSGLRGSGSFAVGHEGEFAMSLDYDFT